MLIINKMKTTVFMILIKYLIKLKNSHKIELNKKKINWKRIIDYKIKDPYCYLFPSTPLLLNKIEYKNKHEIDSSEIK